MFNPLEIPAKAVPNACVSFAVALPLSLAQTAAARSFENLKFAFFRRLNTCRKRLSFLPASRPDRIHPRPCNADSKSWRQMQDVSTFLQYSRANPAIVEVSSWKIEVLICKSDRVFNYWRFSSATLPRLFVGFNSHSVNWRLCVDGRREEGWDEKLVPHSHCATVSCLLLNNTT